ncbi:unnamed protein product [Cochlearia groenlandica]
MKNRLARLRLYKVDVSYESDVGVMLATSGDDWNISHRFQLTRYTGRKKRSRAGLSKSFVENHAPEIEMRRLVRSFISTLKTRDSILDPEDADVVARLVPIAPPATKIINRYSESSQTCTICEKGYPQEDEIVLKTKCNHIFHGNMYLEPFI